MSAIWTTIKGLFTSGWGFITSNVGEYMGIGAAAIGAWAMIKKSGETAIELKEEANTLKAVGVKQNVEKKVSTMSDSQLDNELRKHQRD